MTMLRPSLFVVWLSALASCTFVVNAKTPDAEIRVNDKVYEGAYGYFGSRSTIQGILRLAPSSDPLLCDFNTSIASGVIYPEGTILLVPRGECSFEGKTVLAQELGAAGVLIYNTLASRYGYNETSNETRYPKDRHDYECDNGRTVIDSPLFPDLDPPAYNTSIHDSFLKLDSPDNLCNIPTDKCASKRCLLTNQTALAVYQACCAWDIHIGMDGDDRLKDQATDEVAVFLTMEQGDTFIENYVGQEVRIVAKWYPKYNASSFLLWLMACAIVGFAAWYSAKDYRRAKYKLTHPQPRPQQEPTRPPPTIEMTSPTEVPSGSNETSGTPPVESAAGQHDDAAPENSPTNIVETIPEDNPAQSTDISSPPQAERETEQPSDPPAEEQAPPAHPMRFPRPNRRNRPMTATEAINRAERDPYASGTRVRRNRGGRRRNRRQNNTRFVQRNQNADGSTELTVWHAAMFVVIASCMLLLLFYLEFYTVVAVLYGIGCSGSLSQVLLRPFYQLFSKLTRLNCGLTLCPKVVFCGLGELTYLDILSSLSGLIIGIMWLVVYFTSNNPSSVPFYWITQNVMGACISILFMYLMKLNSIKVATVLMTAIFIYDIFFVFISPYIFNGESVMVTVATGGGPGDVTADYCTKYPDDPECKKGQPLPMLLTIPKINDFRGGANLLGLGDIVLPGLLIAFAARLDEAKRLVNDHTNLNIIAPPRGGYLLYLIIAYAIGLLFANLAVVWMQRGQPALLYLVPACLGTLFWFGRSELSELWKGPRVLTWADRLVLYCDSHTFVARDAATVAESVEDDIESINGDEEEQVAQQPTIVEMPEGITSETGSTRELT